MPGSHAQQMGFASRRTQVAAPAAALDRTGVLIAQAELAHHAGQAIRLLTQRFGGGGRLLDQGRVLLGHLIDLVHGLVHIANAGGLLGRRGTTTA